jgi:hypothetical protein
MAKDLVGKRKVHKEKGKEAGLGFTYKKLSNGHKFSKVPSFTIFFLKSFSSDLNGKWYL